MWERLNDLNSRFKKIKASSKTENEKSSNQQLFCNKLGYFFNLILIFNCKKNI